MESHVLGRNQPTNQPTHPPNLKRGPQIYTVKVSETVDFTDMTSIAAILCPVGHDCWNGRDY